MPTRSIHAGSTRCIQAHRPQATRQRPEGPASDRRSRLALIAAGMMVALLAGCASVPDPVTGQPTYNSFTLDDEVRLGEEVQRQNLGSFRQMGVPINADRKQLRRIEQTITRLRTVVELPDLPWEAHLIQTNIVNAAAAPGGKVIVFSGLFDPRSGMVRNDDELAAVMAHEMAHVTCRHVTESLTRQMGMETGAQIVAAVLGQTAGSRAVDAFSYVYAGASMLLIPHYSREQETEADRVGLFYMARAGYDPHAALEIWRRAADAAGGGGDGLFGFLSSHPSNLTRLRDLQRELPAAYAEYMRVTGKTPAPVTALPETRPASPSVARPAPPAAGAPLRGIPVVRARPVGGA